MRGVFVLLLLMSLGGCLPDRDKDLATCRTEANRFFRAAIADDPENPKSQYIIECMAAKGYDFTVVPKNCDNRYPFPTQSACYAPTSWLDVIVEKLLPAEKTK